MKPKALILTLFSVYTFLVLPMAPVWAQELRISQNTDITAPKIQHEARGGTAPTGKSLIVRAIVTDDLAVKEVLLFYRIMGNTEYFSLKMNSTGDQVYSGMIPSEDVLEPGLEYYIQASDVAGNMVLRGFSFSPLVVTVAPVLPGQEPSVEEKIKNGGDKTPVVETPTASEPMVLKTEEDKSKAWYQKWWVWAIAGGVVIAAAAGGGGGGGGGGGAGAPPTGTLTVGGPLP